MNIHKQDTANLCSVARYNLKTRVTREREREKDSVERELRAPEFIGLIIAYSVI